jgi:hypothetical protein
MAGEADAVLRTQSWLLPIARITQSLSTNGTSSFLSYNYRLQGVISESSVTVSLHFGNEGPYEPYRGLKFHQQYYTKYGNSD